MKHTEKNSLIKSKLLYTVLILVIYLLGKGIPLYMIDVSEYMHRQINAETLLVQTISGDIYQCSLFALGISPYMVSSIIIQIVSLFRNSESRKKLSPIKINKMTMGLTVIVACIMAVVRVQELRFRITGSMLPVAQMIAVLEMVTGAMIILHLASRNRKYGIGGQSALIYINILDGIRLSVQGSEMGELWISLVIALFVMIIMLFMENTELRIPVQRISIHNIYADKNYLAIKFNPIGVMPAMFSTAFFMLPQLLISVLLWFFPENTNILWWQEAIQLSKPLGIGIYAVLLYVLTVGFSRVLINPGELTEQFLKSGDSIRDLHAGKDTQRYLSHVITGIGFLSATVMNICLCVPLLLQLMGTLESSFATLPSSVMMLTGIFCELYREVMAVRDLEAYKPFI